MSDESKQPELPENPPGAPLHGLLAEYATPGDLIRAARKVRDAGFEKWDTFTPFPVHGIDPAMGIKPTKLPWIVFFCGLTGFGIAVWMQWWMNAVDYPWIVSGKPFWSMPANVPVWFERTVLLSAFGALFGMLALNGLPEPSHPLDLKRRFARSTDDKFFLLIQAADPKFDEDDTFELLESTSPVVLDQVPEDRVTPDHLPRGIVYGLVILAVLAVIPFAFIAKAREARPRDPRVHVVADMDWQPKYLSQQKNAFFADERAMRTPPPGTVAVGQARLDDHLYRGKSEAGSFALTFPKQVEPTLETMQRGKVGYEVYCGPCHGLAGNGDGMVQNRASDLAEGTWIPATNINQDYIRQQPVGQLFDTITHGIRNMPPYGHLIEPEDRWAIVMYIRALQKSQE
jgi:mono/diheme cytochrome c family protein